MATAESPQHVVSHFVARARRLYSLPAVAMRVLELTSDATVDIAALTECLENDPALTTKILRVANSSLFGLSQQVGSLKQAVALLGLRPLKMLVLGFSLPSNLAAGAAPQVLGRYWRHAVLQAVAAREIAQEYCRVSGDEAFVGGLLQNLGVLVLVQDLGDSYERFLLDVWEQGCDLATEECRVLGFDHRYLTAQLLEHWNLPPSLVEMVQAPHDADKLSALDGPSATFARVLHLAAAVATFLIDQHPQQLDLLLHLGHRYCGLTMPQLESLMKTLEQNVPPLTEVLTLSASHDTDYSAVLLTAHRRLSDVLEDVTVDLLDSSLRPREILSATAGLPAPMAAPTEPVFQLPRWEDSAVAGAGEPRSVADRSPAERGMAGARPPTRDAAARRSEPFSWSTREGLIERIVLAVGHCRHTRSSLSLVLIELDEIEKVTFYCGLDSIPEIVRRLGVTIHGILEGEGSIFQLDETRFAVVLEKWDRRRAAALGWRMVDGVRIWKFPHPMRLQAGLSISVGLATLTVPPKSFPAEELLAAAQRCLSGVQLSGGDGVKSIDIY